MKYFFETYGCQMNVAESEALVLALRERHWEAATSAEDADVVVINTCSVRATAEQRVLGRLSLYAALKKKGARFTLLVAGCMASRLRAKLKAEAVDYVMGTNEREQFPRLLEAIERDEPFVDEKDEKKVFSFAPVYSEADKPVRAFVPIMHGCDNFCAYCIVPYVRGREVSRDPAAILAEIKLLAEKGAREIVLLGQNVNSFRWETTDFPALLERIAETLAETGGKRWVRFLSSHPKDLSAEVVQVMARYPVFCRHLHLCVQSGSNTILAAMNRRYTRERYLDVIDALRAAMPDISLSTDILIGFPGESDADFEQTLDIMDRVRFLYAYMYHYNPREGTAAFMMENRVPDAVKQARLAELIALQSRHTRELLQERVGARAPVLVEGLSRRNAADLMCRTERDERVVFSGPPSLIATFTELRLTSLKGNTFRGERIEL